MRKIFISLFFIFLAVKITHAATPTPIATCTRPPSIPTNLTPSGTIPAGINSLKWANVTGATSYKIKIDDLANAWSGSCGSPNSGDFCATSTANSYSYSFKAGSSYYWWVNAQNACGTSDSSTRIKVAVSAITVSPGCPLTKPKGDANCNGIVDIKDFEIWRREFTGLINTGSADFNSDQKVTTADYGIWKNNVL